MFTLLKNPTFKTTARIIVPTDEGEVEQTLGVKFRLMEEGSEAMGVAEFLDASVLGMDDIVDDAGAPVAYDDALRARMIALPYVRVGLMRAYWAAVSKAKLGN